MRLRQRRSTGRNRRAIGAAAIAGVLVLAGATGMQFASAGVIGSSSSDIVVVDGEEFDVAGCDDLQINDGSVICDGEALAPVDDLGAAEAAELGAAALEASCDVFAAGLAVAENEADDDTRSSSSGDSDDDGRDVEDDELVEDDEAADQQAAVADAQQQLLLACLELAEAKAGQEAADQDEQNQDEQNQDEQNQDADEAKAVTVKPARSARN
jgi:hypothetical protein